MNKEEITKLIDKFAKNLLTKYVNDEKKYESLFGTGIYYNEGVLDKIFPEMIQIATDLEKYEVAAKIKKQYDISKEYFEDNRKTSL